MEENKSQTISYNGDKGTVREVLVQLLGEGAKKISEKQFLDMEFPKQEEGPVVRNRTTIYRNYTPQEQWEANGVYQDGILPFINKGTQLILPNELSEVEYEAPSQRESYMKQKNESSLFWSKNYERLIKDPEYISTQKIEEENSINTQVIAPNVRVWIYSESMRKLIDISKFIVSCVTDKTNQHGSFQITLPPLYGEELLEGDLNFKGGGDFHHTSSPLSEDSKTFKKSPFRNYFNHNDIVFIRFETLQVDQDTSEYSTEIPLNQLSEIPKKRKDKPLVLSKRERSETNNATTRVWDMIALIDTVSESYNAQDNDVTVSIQGRDLMKLLSDDGSYFIPEMFVAGSSKRWLYGGSSEDSWFRRNVIDGNLPYMSMGDVDIKTTLQFFINKLSNIEIVQADVFQSYKDKRIEPYEVKIQTSSEDKVEGIWTIVKLFVEDRLESRRVVDKSLRNPADSILGLFDKICQEPFVELLGDTYGNTFDLVARQPPFSRDSIMSMMTEKAYITVETRDLLNFDLSYDQRSYSWYQIKPRNSFFGQSSATSLAFTPIIYLEDFAKWRGNRRMILEDIYLSTRSLTGNVAEYDLNLMSNALANDLLFVIETNVYLPFTRTGTITLNGDRRIKCGTFIFLEATGEFFYVTGITHTYSISEGGGDRATVLRVERGMLKKYIEGTEEQTVDYETNKQEAATYFNICNTEEIRQRLLAVKDPCEELAIFEKFKINKAIFNTFRTNFEK